MNYFEKKCDIKNKRTVTICIHLKNKRSDFIFKLFKNSICHF